MKKYWKQLVAAGAITLVLGFVVYTIVRVNIFVNSVFSDSTPQTSILRLTPTAQPTLAPPTATLVPPTTAPLSVATALPTVAPTATPIPLPTATATPLPLDAAIVQKIKAGQRITGLIMGYGGTGHDGAYLTDTLMVVSYDPTQNAVSMISVPRDLYTQIVYGGYTASGQPKAYFWSKINAAFAYVMGQSSPDNLDARYKWTRDDQKIDAAANLTRDTVEQVIGVPIDYWAAVNFDGFRKLIDALGGVDVTVEKAFDDYEYPANDDANVDASVMHIHFDAGLQHMNGERAIEFSRSRKSIQDGSDFARSKRQMLVMQAIRTKVTQPSVLLQLFGIMDALQGNVRTNLSLKEVQGLIDYVRSPDGSKMATQALFVPNVISTDNFLVESNSPDTGDIVYPGAGMGNYKAIQAWIKSGFNGPDLRREAATIQLFNATGNSGTAANEYSALADQGFLLNDPRWAATQADTLILDFSGGKATATLAHLRQLYPDATILSGPAASKDIYSQFKSDGVQFSVVLGHNFQGHVNRPSSSTDGHSLAVPNVSNP